MENNRNQTIITYISINDAVFYDIEILVTPSGKIYLPFKQIMEIFEVPFQINHSTKQISFETADKKHGTVSQDLLSIDGKPVFKEKNFFLKKGLIEETKDEYFVSENVLSSILSSEIKSDSANLSVSAKTGLPLSALNLAPEVQPEDEKPYKAYTQVVVPEKKKIFTLDSIGISNNTTSNSMSQIVANQQSTNMFFNNNTQLSFKGEAFGGDYVLDMNTYNYKGELFSFGGLGLNYKNSFKGINYELGRLTGFPSEDYSSGTNVMGVQLGTVEQKKTAWNDISGYVDSGSVVNVYINDELKKTLSTYNGYYTLQDMYLSEKPKKIMLEELKKDGTKKEILTKVFPKYDNMLSKGERRYSLIGGVSGFNNKLFNNNGYIYEMNAKKLVLGGLYRYGLKENLTLDTKIVHDKILYQPQDSIFINLYNSDSMLYSGTYRNPNFLEGTSIVNSIDYLPNDNLRLRATAAFSKSSDKSIGEEEQAGYSFNISSDYKKGDYTLGVGVYNASPNFYLAGNEGGFLSDRLGAVISGGVTKQNFSINARYNKYLSNLNKRYDGGLIGFDDVYLGFNANLKNFAQLRFNLNHRAGENAMARNRSYYYDLNLSKRINNYLALELGKQESNYATDYFTEGKSGFSSVYSNLYAKANIMLPKNKGSMTLANEIVEYKSGGTSNSYNIARVAYTFPTIKRLSLTLGAGYKYKGFDDGLEYMIGLGYTFKSGRTASLNYQYSKNGGYFLNNMYFPMSARHSVNLSVNDNFAFLPSGLKSIGANALNKGFVEVVAYLDKNKNGKFDEDIDVGVENIPVKCSWQNENGYTNSKGKYIPQGAEKGIYKVKIDTDNLLATVSLPKDVKENQIIRINTSSTTRVEFPLVSSVGNITGTLKVCDDFGRSLNMKEFIVVLHDEEDKEAAYTTVNEDGTFYISGVPPGTYTVKLDSSFIDEYALTDSEEKGSAKVEIPYVYKDFVDIKDIELSYKTLSI